MFSDGVSLEVWSVFEECDLLIGTDTSSASRLRLGSAATGSGGFLRFLNSRITIDKAAGFIAIGRCGVYAEFDHCDFPLGSVIPTDLIHCVANDSGTATLIFNGCDLSDQSGTLANFGRSSYSIVHFKNCQLHASATLAGASALSPWRVENHGSSTQTGLGSSNSVQALQIETESGTIEDETTAVRTDGASDGATGTFSWKMTPTVNDTWDNYQALISPWAYQWIEGDGTSQTLTIYIANSGAGDYQNDEVWLEVMFPDAADGP